MQLQSGWCSCERECFLMNNTRRCLSSACSICQKAPRSHSAPWSGHLGVSCGAILNKYKGDNESFMASGGLCFWWCSFHAQINDACVFKTCYEQLISTCYCDLCHEWNEALGIAHWIVFAVKIYNRLDNKIAYSPQRLTNWQWKWTLLLEMIKSRCFMLNLSYPHTSIHIKQRSTIILDSLEQICIHYRNNDKSCVTYLEGRLKENKDWCPYQG